MYHDYDPSQDSHLFVFLQPHPQSKFDDRLAVISRRPESTRVCLEQPFRLHEVFIDTYIENWRWYLRDLADDFKEGVSQSVLSPPVEGGEEERNRSRGAS